jgi:hypothetical protein
MTTITTAFGTGGGNLVPGTAGGTPTLATTLRDVADDLTELRTQLIALLAKLDADAGVTDTDYESSLTPAALLTVKG